MGDLKRGIKGSYDSMRRDMGLKGPSRKKLEKRQYKEQVSDLDDEQLGAIEAQMGVDPESLGSRKRRRRGRGLSGMVNSLLNQQQGGTLLGGG